ncbi:MAG: glycosyltransferase family 4 protein [Sphingomonas sp.]|uniref:glycosyltransferase family 4 protein n=1 Tax=Sphingomonas sp. TaxID=28214 RepID=UPI001B249126|nr:glycosyltransferase family 4 protein [Sphingomonas sp.]MBO9622444.1 glycosyltransferase family 4 protein [Sphingomonas sp.]
MPRILALTKYGRRAASTRQRLEQYLPLLAEQRIEFDIRPLLDDDYLARLAEGRPASRPAVAAAYARRLKDLLAARSYDALWIQYELFPYLPGPFERLAGMVGVPLLVDYDDAIFHTYDHNRRALVRRLLGNKLAPLLRHTTVAMCGNAYLRDYAARYCPDTVIIPTVVDTAIYRPAERARGGAVIGWIGSPSTWSYVVPLLPTLLPLLVQKGARLRVVGAGPAARGIEGVDSVDWNEAREIADIQSMDVGIMPLTDDLWSRGKCGYKLIQYMACGLPVVASPVGVNRDIVAQGENGFLASDPAEWVAALTDLLERPDLGRTMGASGRERVVERYSVASQREPLLEAITRALEHKRAR